MTLISMQRPDCNDGPVSMFAVTAKARSPRHVRLGRSNSCLLSEDKIAEEFYFHPLKEWPLLPK